MKDAIKLGGEHTMISSLCDFVYDLKEIRIQT